MTDPKLVERANHACNQDHYSYMEGGTGFDNCDQCHRITKALQAHGEEVRRKTVEECARVLEDSFPYIDPDVATAIRKLLEVKGA